MKRSKRARKSKKGSPSLAKWQAKATNLLNKINEEKLKELQLKNLDEITRAETIRTNINLILKAVSELVSAESVEQLLDQ